MTCVRNWTAENVNITKQPNPAQFWLSKTKPTKKPTFNNVYNYLSHLTELLQCPEEKHQPMDTEQKKHKNKETKAKPFQHKTENIAL